MAKAIISGAVQGIAEWLPIGSEGLLVLIKANIFKGNAGADLLAAFIL